MYQEIKEIMVISSESMNSTKDSFRILEISIYYRYLQ